MSKSIYPVLLFILTASSSAFSASDNVFDFDASLSYDNNVTRASNSADIESDSSLGVGARYSRTLLKSLYSSLQGVIELRLNQSSNFEGLNNTEGSAGFIYSFAFEPGFGKAWYSIEALASSTEFDSKMRDKSAYRVGITVGKRWDDKTDTRYGVVIKSEDAVNRIFDRESTSVYANIDWMLSSKNTLYTTLGFQQGDLVYVIEAPSGSGLGYSVANVIAAGYDDVFTGDYAYRVDADVTYLTLGFNKSFSESQALDISLRHLVATAESGTDYGDTAVFLSYLYRL